MLTGVKNQNNKETKNRHLSQCLVGGRCCRWEIKIVGRVGRFYLYIIYFRDDDSRRKRETIPTGIRL